MSYYDNSAVAQAIADTSDYITRRYGTGTNRHWWGIAHRLWLLDSGRYIRTSRRRWKIVGEDGPELVKFRP